MRPQEIIAKKRDGEILTSEEINSFVNGVCDNGWADYQVSALIMACFINGLDLNERTLLTQAMLNSGEIMDFPDIDLPKADKHSTGGVGDKTSLIIAPLAAACGIAVPMISGRGLGHTGGTLDKLESIENYNVKLSAEEFKDVLKKCGFALAGQTEKIVPADRKLYALRDATATVESIPLIVASIMSKKLAEDLNALVLDVKTGSGAFMKNFEDAKKLAEALVKTGNNCGVKTEAVISDMNQPLGKYAGNALEVYECLKILRGEADQLMESTKALSIELTARMIVLSGKNGETFDEAKKRCEEMLANGIALEKFRQNIELQGGNPAICENPEILIDKSVSQFSITAESSGFVAEINAFVIGESIVKVRGGRTRVEDEIDYAVGFQCERKIGDKVKAGEALGILFCRHRNETVEKKLQTAYRISEERISPPKLIKEVIS